MVFSGMIFGRRRAIICGYDIIELHENVFQRKLVNKMSYINKEQFYSQIGLEESRNKIL